MLVFGMCLHHMWFVFKLKKSAANINATFGPQTALILVQWIMLFEAPFSNESITDENLTQRKNWRERYSLSGKNYNNISTTVASMSGVVVVNVLWRMAVDISNTAISLELKLDLLIDNCVY